MKAFYLLFFFSIVSFGQHTDNDGYGKGAPERPTYANSFYGNGTAPKNLHLNGRTIEKSDFDISDIDCDEVGKVVVKVVVNKQGRVISAAMSKGTTNSSACLVNPCIEKAKSFTWKADANAPDTQIGYVVFVFAIIMP